MSNELPHFIGTNAGFDPIGPDADFLHPKHNATVASDTCTETQYFGFSVPQEKIHCLAFLWHHPKLHVVTGGILVWQGIKRSPVHAELFDWRVYMSDAVLKNDLHEYRLENGYGVKVLEPLKRLHMTYADPERKNSVDLMFEATLPAVMFAGGRHFEQAMKVRGELVLRGKRYAVDCYNVRDRSWANARSEANQRLPPMSWMTGVFRDDFAFNCCVMDQVRGNPEIAGRFELPEERTLNAGWIHRDGKLGRIVRAQKRVQRAPETMAPMVVDVEAVDDLGRTLNLHGTLQAICPFAVWPSTYQHHPLMRWECDGLVTYGDCQEGIWTDYVNEIVQKRS